LRPDELDLTRLSIPYSQGRIYTSGAGKAQTKPTPPPRTAFTNFYRHEREKEEALEVHSDLSPLFYELISRSTTTYGTLRTSKEFDGKLKCLLWIICLWTWASLSLSHGWLCSRVQGEILACCICPLLAVPFVVVVLQPYLGVIQVKT